MSKILICLSYPQATILNGFYKQSRPIILLIGFSYSDKVYTFLQYSISHNLIYPSPDPLINLFYSYKLNIELIVPLWLLKELIYSSY